MPVVVMDFFLVVVIFLWGRRGLGWGGVPKDGKVNACLILNHVNGIIFRNNSGFQMKPFFHTILHLE